MDYAFEYLRHVNFCFEDSYPYEAKNSICRKAECKNKAHAVDSFFLVDTSKGANELKRALNLTPVAVAVEAG